MFTMNVKAESFVPKYETELDGVLERFLKQNEWLFEKEPLEDIVKIKASNKKKHNRHKNKKNKKQEIITLYSDMLKN
jgi:hypothetical protein